MSLHVPTGPIFRTDSDAEKPTYRDSEASHASALRSWRELAREQAFSTARLSPEIDAVAKYAQCLLGNFWDKRRAKFKSPYYDNRLNNSRQSDLALLTDTRPTISVSSSVDAYKQQAEMAMKSIQMEWSRENMDLDLVRCVDITKLNGTGFWKLGAACPGIMQVVPCGPDNVLPIQPGFDLQQSSAVLYRTHKKLSYFLQKFPFTSSNLEKESNFTERTATAGDSKYGRPGDIPEYTWNGLSPQIKRLLSVETSASEMTPGQMFGSIELQEFYIDDPSVNDSRHRVLMRHPYLSLTQHNYWYWVDPGKPLYPRKRLIVYAGRKPVYDGPAPFWHGQYPFACMRLNPVPWSFWGLSKYRDLIPLNQAMNEIGAGIMDMVKRALNPVAISKAGSVPYASWREFYPEMPGAKLYMNNNATVNDVRYMDPPNIPQWVLLFHQYLGQEFDRIAGSIDVTALGKKKQVPGGDTIEQMRELMNSITRLESRYIEKFLEDAGVQAVSNFFQHFTIGRRIQMLGGDGITWHDFDYSIGQLVPDNIPKEDFWRMFATKIGVGSLLSNAKDREKQTAIALASKSMFPLKALWRMLDLPADELWQELEKEHEAGMQITGRTPRTTRGQKNGKAA